MARMSDEAIDTYIDKAMESATVEQIDGDNFFASVPKLRGAWGDGKDAQLALTDLRLVLHSWIDLALDDEKNLPVLD